MFKFCLIAFLFWSCAEVAHAQLRNNATDSIKNNKYADSIPNLEPVKVFSNYRRNNTQNDKEEYEKYLKYEKAKATDAFKAKLPFLSNDAKPEDNAGTFSVLKVKVSIGTLIDAFRKKKKDKKLRLKQLLLDTEQSKYIDSRFNKQHITKYTNVSSDSLLNPYIFKYRPNFDILSQMNEIDLALYIKKTFKLFLENRKTLGKTDPNNY